MYGLSLLPLTSPLTASDLNKEVILSESTGVHCNHAQQNHTAGVLLQAALQ